MLLCFDKWSHNTLYNWMYKYLYWHYSAKLYKQEQMPEYRWKKNSLLHRAFHNCRFLQSCENKFEIFFPTDRFEIEIFHTTMPLADLIIYTIDYNAENWINRLNEGKYLDPRFSSMKIVISVIALHTALQSMKNLSLSGVDSTLIIHT